MPPEPRSGRHRCAVGPSMGHTAGAMDAPHSPRPTGDELDRAAAMLRAGGLVAFPTETVYGLGADAGNAEAVAKIFAVKGRPPGHPLIVHLGSVDVLDAWAAD